MNTFDNNKYTTQQVGRLNLKTCKALVENNFLTKSGREYCEFAIRARIVELEQKQAETATKKASKHEATYVPPTQASNDFPPAMVNSFATQTVVAALMKVKKPLFIIGKKLGFTFSKSLEQLENNVVTTTYKFEVKF